MTGDPSDQVRFGFRARPDIVIFGSITPVGDMSIWDAMLRHGKGRTALRRKRKTTSINIHEFSPQGTRLDVTNAGRVSGKVSGLTKRKL
jgi:hypothetical protein